METVTPINATTYRGLLDRTPVLETMDPEDAAASARLVMLEVQSLHLQEKATSGNEDPEEAEFLENLEKLRSQIMDPPGVGLIIKKRWEVTGFLPKITVPAQVYFTLYAHNPGKAVMWAYTAVKLWEHYAHKQGPHYVLNLIDVLDYYYRS